ncbi:putative baseplate assembly protein [Geodermatophilus dictyosporus]|uniref:Putative baseplate assembly protein n=1 Tax=Geodermatophilus dictyosporus TaxID=1523247 RepID=A0A1I5JPR1_9ACTN|nr:putative baseplate assembly protein [Geodermatophilus dictyosporus]SFO74777.1 putative baseplate assembly protein [Geodermatophilus dictyosporus]
MTVPFPVLDDRDYDQLLAELRARIPVYTPEWSDLGPSDPGVTLLELVAHLGETLLFRFNQIPDQTRLWLLRLLQVPPYPPRRATGLVTFTADRAGDEPAEVPLGSVATAGSVPFRVGNDVTVLPVTVTAVVKAATAFPTDPVLTDELNRVLDAAGLDEDTAQPYEEAVLRTDPTAAGRELLDVRSAVDRCLWLAVHAQEGTPGAPEEQRRALLPVDRSLGRRPLVLGFGTEGERPTIDDVDPCAGAEVVAGDAGLVPAAERPGGTPDRIDSSLVWQVSAVTGDHLPVGVVRDTTDGLRHSGVVALQLPTTRLTELGVAEPEDPDLAGVGDAPPVLAGGPPVLFWLRAFPRQGVPEIGNLRWVGVNAAEVEQVAEAPTELLGSGQGVSHQELALTNTPVVPGSLLVEVCEDGERWVPWDVVESLAASSPGDRALLLDPGAGRIECGDSVRGRVLPVGAPVRAVAYRHGGGRQGNVAAGAVDRLVDVSGVTVTNPLPTAGGEEAESLTRAMERIPGELSRHDRAVVAEDFRELATVPGVGRAECLPRFHPPTRSTDAAGVVTVVVWPAEDPRHPDAPSADATLLRAVCSRLDERRLVTTELHVVPPTYHPVAVSVGLAVHRGYSEIGVRRWVELVLRQYLSPLPPYGPEGRGWPLGRRVHGPELEAAVLQVEGVEFIEELLVADLSEGEPVPGTVALAGWEVPELREVTVVVGAPPPAGSGSPSPLPPTSPSAPAPVPVPVPREEC